MLPTPSIKMPYNSVTLGIVLATTLFMAAHYSFFDVMETEQGFLISNLTVPSLFVVIPLLFFGFIRMLIKLPNGGRIIACGAIVTVACLINTIWINSVAGISIPPHPFILLANVTAIAYIAYHFGNR